MVGQNKCSQKTEILLFQNRPYQTNNQKYSTDKLYVDNFNVILFSRLGFFI
jgi:hypothetical protein